MLYRLLYAEHPLAYPMADESLLPCGLLFFPSSPPLVILSFLSRQLETRPQMRLCLDENVTQQHDPKLGEQPSYFSF